MATRSDRIPNSFNRDCSEVPAAILSVFPFIVTLISIDEKSRTPQGSTAFFSHFPTLALSSSGSKGYPRLSYQRIKPLVNRSTRSSLQLTIDLFATAPDRGFS